MYPRGSDQTQAEEEDGSALARLIARDATLWLLIIMTVGVLSFGGVHPWARAGLAAGALLGLAWAWLRYAWQGRRMPIGAMGLALVIALGWTFLQWVPLPLSIVEVLAPHTAEAARTAARAADTSVPLWLPMSLAPTRTAMGWLTLAGYTAVFLVAADLTRRRRGRAVVLAVEVVALMALATALGHAAFGANAVYGVEGAEVASPFVSTFLNPKHAGALLAMGAIVALGRWLEAEARYHLGIAALLGAGVAATGTRSNLGVLVAGWGVLLTLAYLRRGGRGRPWIAMVVTLAAVAVLVMAVFPGVWSDAATSTGVWRASIMAHWSVGADVAGSHLWVGTGMEAFHAVAAGFTESFDKGLLDHAHNLPLQLVADWGLPVSVLVVGLFLAGFVRNMQAVWFNLGMVGLGVALIALGVQNLVDFSAYIPGVGLAAAALAGALSGCGDVERLQRDPEAAETGPRWARVGLASVEVGALLLATVLTATHLVDHGRDRYQLRVDDALQRGAPRAVDLATLVAHHPHDYYTFRLAGRLALADGEPGRAQGLLALGAELAPRHAGTQLDLARVAIAMNAEVTAVDHLIAASASSLLARRKAAGLVALWPVDSGATAQFLGSSPQNALAVVTHLQLKGKHLRARRVGERAMNFHRDAPMVWLRAIEVAAAARDAGRLEALAAKALAKARSGSGYARPWWVAGHWAHALAAEVRGEVQAGASSLAEARKHAVAGETPRLDLTEAAVAVETQDWKRAREILTGLEKRIGSSPGLHVRLHQLRSRMAVRDNDMQQAIAHLHRALTYLPGDPATLTALSRLKSSP